MACALAIPLAANADGKRYSGTNPAYQAECGSCHVAYPPALLGADGWNAIMSNLQRHFGTDASIGEAQRADLAAYLRTAAGARASGGTVRITDTPWFGKEHRRIDAATWKSPAVKSRSNCEACHRGAASGDFDEHGVRIPREASR